MRILPRNHISLGMPRISLGRFDISLVELQLVSSAGMTKGMKDYIWQSGIFFQTIKAFFNQLSDILLSKRVKITILLKRNWLKNWISVHVI